MLAEKSVMFARPGRLPERRETAAAVERLYGAQRLAISAGGAAAVSLVDLLSFQAEGV